jgi:acetyltransferase-like isoleucine patch superfamily enzyme
MLSKLVLNVGRLPTRLLQKARQAQMRRACTAGDRVQFHHSSSIDNFQGDFSSIVIGSETHVLGQLIVFPNGGRITIGSHCYIGENSRIWSMSEVTIGDRVQISHGVNIHDNSAHSLSAAERHMHLKQILTTGHPRILTDVKTMPIHIGNDAWIGFNATILSGVTIGNGAVVGAGSVVCDNVAPYTIVAGNPARIIGQSRA